eukprot:976066-Rhodomonas_salina.2
MQRCAQGERRKGRGRMHEKLQHVLRCEGAVRDLGRGELRGSEQRGMHCSVQRQASQRQGPQKQQSTDRQASAQAHVDLERAGRRASAPRPRPRRTLPRCSAASPGPATRSLSATQSDARSTRIDSGLWLATLEKAPAAACAMRQKDAAEVEAGCRLTWHLSHSVRVARTRKRSRDCSASPLSIAASKARRASTCTVDDDSPR